MSAKNQRHSLKNFNCYFSTSTIFGGTTFIPLASSEPL